jgi:hypothetical protein
MAGQAAQSAQAAQAAGSRFGTARVRRLVGTLFVADALALILDGWTGSPHWFHYDVAWPLTLAFAALAVVHGLALVRAARARDPIETGT